MSWLLDVNMILASRWLSHPHHVATKVWLDSIDSFSTCPITELGFLRISLSPAYGATWDQAQEALRQLHARRACRWLADDVDGTSAAETSYRDTTDAHLVALASRHGLRLATLDGGLTARPWAAGIAVNPLFSSLSEERVQA